MSKVDAMRALREARAAAAAKAAPAKAAPAKAAPAKPAPATSPGLEAKTAAVASGDEQALCGHRSMNGRSCTRDHGHAEKNHRYG